MRYKKFPNINYDGKKTYPHTSYTTHLCVYMPAATRNKRAAQCSVIFNFSLFTFCEMCVLCIWYPTQIRRKKITEFKHKEEKKTGQNQDVRNCRIQK